MTSSKLKCLVTEAHVCVNNLLKGYYLKHNDQVPDLQNVTTYHKIILRLSQARAFSALTLLVGRQEGHPVKNRVVGYWRGYLSGARCRLAYSPAVATATHCLLLQ